MNELLFAVSVLGAAFAVAFRLQKNRERKP